MGSAQTRHEWNDPPSFEAADWDDKYLLNNQPFDWYLSWFDVKDALTNRFLFVNEPNLIVGCGTSLLGQAMFEDGFVDITNIDVSQVAIQRMISRFHNTSLSLMKYFKMDATAMTFEDKSFGGIVDKGTLDSIMCYSDFQPQVTKYLREIFRVLRPNGCYICISSGIPSRRLQYFTMCDMAWTVSHMAQEKSQIEEFVLSQDKDMLRVEANCHDESSDCNFVNNFSELAVPIGKESMCHMYICQRYAEDAEQKCETPNNNLSD